MGFGALTSLIAQAIELQGDHRPVIPFDEDLVWLDIEQTAVHLGAGISISPDLKRR